MLLLDLAPGRSAGPFAIGMPISEAISYLQQNSRSIKRVDFIYSDSNPLGTDLVLSLADDGVLLRFDSYSQRLKIVEIHEFSKLNLMYGPAVCSGPAVPATFVRIYTLIGPTYPGTYDPTTREYVLHYPGLSFVFPIPPKFEHLYKNTQEIPLEFPDATTPVAKRVSVYKGGDPTAPLLPSIPQHSFYFEEVSVNIGKGIHMCKRNKTLLFGTTPQDVLTDLGRPHKIFFKEHDKLRIHASDATDPLAIPPTARDYFYNYFSMGMDIVFDGAKHTIKKFILHTNFPGNVHFNVYVKCNFKIAVPSGSTSESSAGPHATIDSNTRWEDVQRLMGTSGRPLVNDYTSTNNPFGGTRFFGYKDVIFEVMRNGYLSSVTLFVDGSS